MDGKSFLFQTLPGIICISTSASVVARSPISSVSNLPGIILHFYRCCGLSAGTYRRLVSKPFQGLFCISTAEESFAEHIAQHVSNPSGIILHFYPREPAGGKNPLRFQTLPGIILHSTLCVAIAVSPAVRSFNPSRDYSAFLHGAGNFKADPFEFQTLPGIFCISTGEPNA